MQEGIVDVYVNQYAYSVVKENGTIITIGEPYGGGGLRFDNTSNEKLLDIRGTEYGFVALYSDGSTKTWSGSNIPWDGQTIVFGDESLITQGPRKEVESIYANLNAFAALQTDGSVHTWGLGSRGGVSSDVVDDISGEVVDIMPSMGAFAALKENGSVITWGDPEYGGNSESRKENLWTISLDSTQQHLHLLH